MERSYSITHGFGFEGEYYCNGNAHGLDRYTLEELQPFVDVGHLTVVEVGAQEPEMLVEPEQTVTHEDE